MRYLPLICAMGCAMTAIVVGGCATQPRPSLFQLPVGQAAAAQGSAALVDRDVRMANAFTEAMQPEQQALPEAELIAPPPPSAAARPRALNDQDPPEASEMAPQSERRQGDGLRPIGTVSVGIAPPPAVGAAADQSGLPEDLAAQRFHDDAPLLVQSEPFAPWNAYGQLVLSSDFCHNPLYFEDVNLERYGRSHGIAQPFISAARFYGSVPALPYKLVAEPAHVCLRDDSRWPAGGYAPHHRNLPPFSVKAGVIEAATIVGLILLIP